MWLEFDAASDRATERHKLDLALAWHINQLWILTWNGKLPPLKDVLEGQAEAKKPHNGKQIATTLHALAARLGLKVTTKEQP